MKKQTVLIARANNFSFLKMARFFVFKVKKRLDDNGEDYFFFYKPGAMKMVPLNFMFFFKCDNWLTSGF